MSYIIKPYIAAPISPILTSTEAYLIPSLVLALTASSNWSYLESKATVNAESIILPFIWQPKSILQTSDYWSTVWSPVLGV